MNITSQYHRKTSNRNMPIAPLIDVTNQVNQPQIIKEALKVMGKIAKSIVYTPTPLNSNYVPIRERYYGVNNNDCCSKFLSWFGFSIASKLKPDKKDMDHIEWLAKKSGLLNIKLLTNLENSAFFNETDDLKSYLNGLIQFKAGSCLDQCMILVLYLYQENNIRRNDTIKFVSFNNMQASNSTYDENHEGHWILEINDCYIDPLTNVFYDKNKSSQLTHQFKSVNGVKFKGLNDSYRIHETFTFNKQRVASGTTNWAIKFPDNGQQDRRSLIMGH